MVIRGAARSNGRQLARYLTTKAENEDIRVLDANGRDGATDKELSDLFRDWDFSAELTKSDKGLYHAQINPATGESQTMTDADWREASDMLGKQLGMEQQSRAIVLHTKKGRTHAHVVWERYDHEKKKMVSDSFSRLAQDRARKDMEKTFGHQPTPHRNQHRPEVKASLSKLWHSTTTGRQFISAARRHGYVISQGSGRSPYMAVDANGRSFSLNRQIQGARLKDIRERLRGESLPGEKEAISIARKASNDNAGTGTTGTGKQQASLTPKPSRMADNKSGASSSGASSGKSASQPASGGKSSPQSNPQDKSQDKARQFGDNKADATAKKTEPNKQQPGTGQQFKDNKQGVTGQQPQGQQPQQQNTRQQFRSDKEQATGQKNVETKYGENKDMTGGQQGGQQGGKQQEAEKRREEFRKRRDQQKEQADKQKGKGPELGG